MEREFSAAAAMLGLPGFVVLAVSDYAGELEQAIETTADLVGCPECGAVAQLHDRRPTWVRDLPSGGTSGDVGVGQASLVLCARGVPEEDLDRDQRGHRTTGVVDRTSPRRDLPPSRPGRYVGGGGGPRVRHRVAHCDDRGARYGTPRVDDPTRLEGVDAIGVDETAFAAASATRSTSFITGIVDLTRGRGPARLLDVVVGRSASALVNWVNDRHPAWRAGITVAALDPYRGYASALRRVLGTAVRVVDAFHVVRLGFAAVDTVRCRIQREQTGHRGPTGDPLYRIRRLLRRAADHHTQRSWARLLAGLAAGDTPDEQLARTWIAAQDLRLIFHCRGGWPTAPIPGFPS